MCALSLSHGAPVSRATLAVCSSTVETVGTATLAARTNTTSPWCGCRRKRSLRWDPGAKPRAGVGLRTGATTREARPSTTSTLSAMFNPTIDQSLIQDDPISSTSRGGSGVRYCLLPFPRTSHLQAAPSSAPGRTRRPGRPSMSPTTWTASVPRHLPPRAGSCGCGLFDGEPGRVPRRLFRAFNAGGRRLDRDHLRTCRATGDRTALPRRLRVQRHAAVDPAAA